MRCIQCDKRVRKLYVRRNQVMRPVSLAGGPLFLCDECGLFHKLKPIHNVEDCSCHWLENDS